jgi:hypothetical protein
MRQSSVTAIAMPADRRNDERGHEAEAQKRRMTERQVTLPRPDLPRATLGVLFIVVLLALTVWILRPFLGAIVWASMIVVATWPVMRQLQAWLWGSRMLAVPR